MKEKHNQTLELSTRQKTKCINPSCEETFSHHNKLLDHLEQAHTADKQLSQLHFMSMKEFFTWKEAEETKNYIYYSKHTSTKKGKSASYLYYHCQKDGHSKPHGAKVKSIGKQPEATRRMSLRKTRYVHLELFAKLTFQGQSMFPTSNLTTILFSLKTQNTNLCQKVYEPMLNRS